MTQTKLKWVALFSMLLDHTAKIVVASGAMYPYLDAQITAAVYDIMVILGRVAFPIFAWFVAEGCRNTKSSGRYLLRLLLFAILSELPFQYCFYGAAYTGPQLGCHNVLFTFLLSAAAISCGKNAERIHSPVIRYILPSFAAMILGYFLYTDYNTWGIVLVLGLYYLPGKKTRLIYLTVWNAVFYLIWHGLNGTTLVWLTPGGQIHLYYLLGAMLAVILLYFYNGEQGRKMKWLFYLFYPMHLIALYLLSTIALY